MKEGKADYILDSAVWVREKAGLLSVVSGRSFRGHAPLDMDEAKPTHPVVV